MVRTGTRRVQEGARAGKGETMTATRTTQLVSATQVHHHLAELLEERAAARLTPLAANATYMADLEADIAAVRAAYVGAAVTELALLRGAIHGRLQG